MLIMLTKMNIMSLVMYQQLPLQPSQAQLQWPFWTYYSALYPKSALKTTPTNALFYVLTTEMAMPPSYLLNLQFHTE